MEVSPSGYYAWRKRLTTPPSIRRKTLKQLVKNCYWENRKRYGTRRIKATLAKSGVKIGRFQIRRLMKEEGLKAIQPKSFKPRTTDSKGVKASPNLLEGVKLEECAVGKIVIGDITYLPLANGKFCYLAMWQDKVTRRIIGWSVAETMTQELVISALQKAIIKGLVKAGAIIHSDRGSQYAANNFRLLLQTSCFRQTAVGVAKAIVTIMPKRKVSSQDSKRNCWKAESLKMSNKPASEVFSYIEGYYNRVRLHSSLGYKSPLEFEMELKTKNNGGKVSLVSI